MSLDLDHARPQGCEPGAHVCHVGQGREPGALLEVLETQKPVPGEYYVSVELVDHTMELVPVGTVNPNPVQTRSCRHSTDGSHPPVSPCLGSASLYSGGRTWRQCWHDPILIQEP